MDLLREITKVEVLPDYHLKVSFDSGETGVFDMSPLLGYVCYRRLNNKMYFAQARTERGTVVWPYDEDVAPEMLWEQSVKCD